MESDRLNIDLSARTTHERNLETRDNTWTEPDNTLSLGLLLCLLLGLALRTLLWRLVLLGLFLHDLGSGWLVVALALASLLGSGCGSLGLDRGDGGRLQGQL